MLPMQCSSATMNRKDKAQTPTLRISSGSSCTTLVSGCICKNYCISDMGTTCGLSKKSMAIWGLSKGLIIIYMGIAESKDAGLSRHMNLFRDDAMHPQTCLGYLRMGRDTDIIAYSSRNFDSWKWRFKFGRLRLWGPDLDHGSQRSLRSCTSKRLALPVLIREIASRIWKQVLQNYTQTVDTLHSDICS